MGLSFGDLNPVRIVEGKGSIGESGLGSLVVGGAMAAMGVPPSMIPYLVGGTAALATGDLGRGLMMPIEFGFKSYFRESGVMPKKVVIVPIG
jgi:hypothetical protein